jgi:hypothetical protein
MKSRLFDHIDLRVRDVEQARMTLPPETGQFAE